MTLKFDYLLLFLSRCTKKIYLTYLDKDYYHDTHTNETVGTAKVFKTLDHIPVVNFL